MPLMPSHSKLSYLHSSFKLCIINISIIHLRYSSIFVREHLIPLSEQASIHWALICVACHPFAYASRFVAALEFTDGDAICLYSPAGGLCGTYRKR